MPSPVVSGEGPLIRSVVFHSHASSSSSTTDEEIDSYVLLFFETLVNGTPIDYYSNKHADVAPHYSRDCGKTDENDDGESADGGPGTIPPGNNNNNNSEEKVFTGERTASSTAPAIIIVMIIIIVIAVAAILSTNCLSALCCSICRGMRNCKRNCFFYRKDKDNLVDSKCSLLI